MAGSVEASRKRSIAGPGVVVADIINLKQQKIVR